VHGVNLACFFGPKILYRGAIHLFVFLYVFILGCISVSPPHLVLYMKSSDAKASKCHFKFSSLMMIFIKLVYLSSVISLK